MLKARSCGSFGALSSAGLWYAIDLSRLYRDYVREYLLCP